MPSPFPGMDPYLEGELWQEFHETLAGAIRAQLMPRLAPKYVAFLAKRYVVDHSALGVFDVPPPRVVFPDVHVVAPPGTPVEPVPGGSGTITPPAVAVASPTLAPQLSVEVRDVAQRRPVTLIEILSPANKQGDGAREYGARRLEPLQTAVHLLEIDLLRGGARIALTGSPPPAPYYIYLSRSEERPWTRVWPVGLRDRLPTVPVPLLAPDPDVPLDLQAALASCFALVGYERLLPYGDPLPPPALDAADAAWVAATLRAAGVAPESDGSGGGERTG